MSQRVMIDYYLLLAFFFVFVLEKIKIKFLKVSFLVLTSFATLFNIAQTYQVGTGIIPFGSATKQLYWDNFLVFEKRARVYPQTSWKLLDKQENKDSKLSVSENSEYSPILQVTTKKITKGSKLIFSFDATASTKLEETRIVVNLTSGESAVYFLEAYSKINQTVKMEFLFEPQLDTSDSIELFLWNAGKAEAVEIKNITVAHYFSDAYF